MALLVILKTFGLILMAVRYIVIGQFLLYLLIAFNVISLNSPFISGAWRFFSTVLDPLLDPIRRRLPPANGIDFSYMVLLFGLWILNWLLSVLHVASVS